VSLDADGNLFGTAPGGGASLQGTVWEIIKGTNKIIALASFNGDNGKEPSGPATLDANGNLFGTANAGGAKGFGTVWELAKGSGFIGTIASFNGTNGKFPFGNVAFDADGNLYGTTSAGPQSGTLWKIAKGTGNIVTLASFSSATTGSSPENIFIDAKGNIFGTATSGGGANRFGTVWEFDKAAGKLVVLGTFDGTNGKFPAGGIVMDANGNLFGTAISGGANGKGTAWEFDKGAGKLVALASFDGNNGNVGGISLALDTNGNLFGTARAGGPADRGTVWEVAKGAAKINVLDSFKFPIGTDPIGGAILDAKGNLFGTAIGGGANGKGTVWEFSTGGVPEPTSLIMALTSLIMIGGVFLQKSGQAARRRRGRSACA
jgi:uncharacterized repeat protein (TIGR03803 family)